MDGSTDADPVPSDPFGLGTLQSLVDRSSDAHIPIREYAGHWVVRQDDMPEGGADILEAAALALLVSVRDPDHPIRQDEGGTPLRSLDRYGLEPCPDEPEICWRLDHLTLRVYRVH